MWGFLYVTLHCWPWSEDKQLSPTIICFQCPFPGLPCDYFRMGHGEAVFSLVKSTKAQKCLRIVQWFNTCQGSWECICVSEKEPTHFATHRNQVCFFRQERTRLWSERHANRALLSLDRAATFQTHHPAKKLFRFFHFISPLFGECPPKSGFDQGNEDSIVHHANG